MLHLTPKMADIHPAGRRSTSPSPSIVLVGSRGCGKRTLAFIGALHLSRKLVIADRFFETVTDFSKMEYLQKYGEAALQQETVKLVLKMLRENETNCIIECGMSSLNTEVQKFLTEYKKTHPVIYVIRRFEEIKTLLQLGDADAKRLRIGDSKHRCYSDYEYYNISDSGSLSEKHAPGTSPSPHHLKQTKMDFCHFLDRLIGPTSHMLNSPSPFDIASSTVESRLYTYALTVKLSDLANNIFNPSWFEMGHDAVRLVVDANEDHHLDKITNCIARIRRMTHVPIVFEVNGFEKAMSNLASVSDNEYLQLLKHGIRNAVEYVAVNLALPDHAVYDFTSHKGRTKVIGYFHDEMTAKNGWQSQARHDKYQQGLDLGCDLIQLTQVAETQKDNEQLQAFASSIPSDATAFPPLIAYNTGPRGRSSLVFNKILTPVRLEMTAETLEDGYTTAQAAMSGLFAIRVFDSLNFYHFGASVSWSPFPPAMHNAAYHQLGLEHTYNVFETTSLDNIQQIARDPHFGGASISLPFKASILPSIDVKSPHATAIGAINTLLPLRESPETDTLSFQYQASQRNRVGSVIGWYGDNTDWLGILECVHRSLSPRNIIRASTTAALVIGAGGAARAAIYALIQMGCRKILIFNRTPHHAEKVAAHFNEWISDPKHPAVVTVIQAISDPWPAGLQPATIIISCIPAHSIDGQPPANLTLPETWLQSKSGGVVADVSEQTLSTI